MRIALDGFPLVMRRAGVGQYTYRLIDGLVQAGARHSFVIVCPRPLRLLGFYNLPDFGAVNVEVAGHGWIGSLQYTLRARVGRQASVEALIGPFDVYHGTNGTFPTPLDRARRVVTIHDMTLFLFPEWHPRERVEAMTSAVARAAAEADHIVTPSIASAKDLTRVLGVDSARITTIPEAADDSFRPLEPTVVEDEVRRFDLRPGEYLFHLGTLEPRKNLVRLLDALDAAGPEVGPLVLAGASGWEDREVQRRLARPGLAARLRRLGYVADSARSALMNGARVFAYPSLYEGFGLPPLEAMACGTPVLTSDCSSLPEVVGDAALKVDPYDVDAIAAGLRRLWTDADLRAHLGDRGRQRATEFSWRHTAQRTLEVYEAVCRA